jgi:hypothetical protein
MSDCIFFPIQAIGTAHRNNLYLAAPIALGNLYKSGSLCDIIKSLLIQPY